MKKCIEDVKSLQLRLKKIAGQATKCGVIVKSDSAQEAADVSLVTDDLSKEVRRVLTRPRASRVAAQKDAGFWYNTASL